MASARGACVVRYEGKKGVVWRIKYRDADGRQVMETLGRAADGWTEKRAQRELGKRLDDVETRGFRKPEAVTFAEFADRFETDFLPGRGIKSRTLRGYQDDLRLHLRPALGTHRLADMAQRPELIDKYVTEKTGAGLSPKTLRNHVTLLGLMFNVARRWRLVSQNPVELVDKPRGGGREMEVLSGDQIRALLGAYDVRIGLSLGEESAEETGWWMLARHLVIVALGLGFRRGELLALRWEDVSFIDGLVTVDEAYVAGEFTTPKSRTSRRTIEMGPTVRQALEERFRATEFRDPNALVFGHPVLGTPIDPSKLARQYLRPALDDAGVPRDFRAFHDMRHTSLTHEAAVNVSAYVKMKAGHSSLQVTDRYVHAATAMFPGAAAKGEERLFGSAS